MKELILASQSPRRRELLAKCTERFTVEAADIEETMDPQKPLPEEIQKLAKAKAAAVFAKHPEALVLGSDTIVVLDGEVLGKPADEDDAVRMLRELSGRTHQVLTGVCLLGPGFCKTDVSVSHVTFAVMSEAEIREYVASGDPLDKAGAYGIQSMAARYITGIEGDYYAIMGLPVHLVYELLKQAGF